ncbi:hypothetical protein ANME2D_01553 [Candidatus Methanoperedens nitroreducens]|uniref:Uncharacterized protein n=1 Tax=Candidatus Methanoperedens nitratireducens TaxID=1392998 RepID=A0A062V9X4_9EURY|nr:hypothetical protein [Candidatus Methanoperedens nitroreducens]KCZ72150.1 hypothetical protein ANME2D_01553 [Candidatus Methanoperedens nitroreducens]MDJ1421873.1 hypothetical protein [Candidatus Methanoperedens sp.]
MEVKNVVLAVVMIASSMVLTYKWLIRLGSSDTVIIISAVLLIGSLAIMILLVDSRLRELEETVNSKERSIRINIKGVEENLEKKIEDLSKSTSNIFGEFSKRIYR